MCFTIEVHLTRKAIEKRFKVDTSALYDFDFNYFYRAFQNPYIPVIAQEDPTRVQLMQWGLVPAWSRNQEEAERIRKGTYNARAETLPEKPSFRGPLNKGRCLIIAGGFFEWQQLKERKIPWYITLKGGGPFVFAGLYDAWRDPIKGEMLNTCSIITTRANPLLEKIHNTKKRMPVILREEKEKEWLSSDPSLLQRKQLLQALDEHDLKTHTVSSRLSAPDADPSDSDIIKPKNYLSSGSLF